MKISRMLFHSPKELDVSFDFGCKYNHRKSGTYELNKVAD